MFINTKNVISVTDANQNFTNATRMADKNGSVIIYKRNKPQYILMNLDESPIIEMTDEEKILFVGQRILHKHINAFKELAK